MQGSSAAGPVRVRPSRPFVTTNQTLWCSSFVSLSPDKLLPKELCKLSAAHVHDTYRRAAALTGAELQVNPSALNCCGCDSHTALYCFAL